MSEAEVAEKECETPQYAIVEVFGHRRIVGEIREVEQYGAKMLRIDVPNKGGDFVNGFTTQFYGGAAIFSVTPCDMQTVERLNEPYRSASTYHLPAPEDDSGDLF